MERRVLCAKLRKEAPGLVKPPYPGPLGQKIYEQVSAEAWRLWLARQTMFINEYRLNLLESQAREFLNAECQKFLFEEGVDTKPSGYVAPESQDPQ